MKLYAALHDGEGLGLDVLLTGQVTERHGKLHRVEIALPTGCDAILGNRVEALPRTLSGQQLLWVDPGNICADDGMPLNQDQIRAEVARVNEERRLATANGPLSENWP